MNMPAILMGLPKYKHNDITAMVSDYWKGWSIRSLCYNEWGIGTRFPLVNPLGGWDIMEASTALGFAQIQTQ